MGEAYAVLSDQKKKARYDSGQDLEDLDGGGFAGGWERRCEGTHWPLGNLNEILDMQFSNRF